MSSILDFFDEIKLYIMGALAVSTAVAGGLAYHEHAKYKEEVRDRAVDEATYKQAQADAIAVASQNKTKEEAKDNAAKQTADAQYDSLKSAYAAILQRRQTTTSAGKPTANLPFTAYPADQLDRAGTDSVVSVPQSDLLICANNTAKAQVAHDYILSITQP